MSYWRQFQTFDPINYRGSYGPYYQLSGIVWRARNLLRGRTREGISDIAGVASYMIDDYFRQAKEDEIERLKREGLYEFLERDEDGADWDIKSERIAELDLPTEENTSDFDALFGCSCSIAHTFDEGFPEPKEYEYFAALALWKVADAVYRVNFEYDYSKREDTKKDRKKIDLYDYLAAGQYAIEAMEAVCHAERIMTEERMEKRCMERLELEKNRLSTEAQEANEQKWNQLRADEAEQKSDRAREMARLSHRKRDEARAAVLAEWEKNPRAFHSVARAGRHFVSWLDKNGFEYFEQRTVTDWILKYAKEKNIPLR